MKRKIICGIAASVLALSLTACGEVSTTTLEVPNNSNIEISYIAEFYDNYGEEWMSTKGTSFNISPNKVKEYSYDSNGSWISQWTTSSKCLSKSTATISNLAVPLLSSMTPDLKRSKPKSRKILLYQQETAIQ